MDAVILAGGRGSRLSEIAPPFHKPLLPVNGIPLVLSAVQLAKHAGVEVPVVVVSPQNAEEISRVLGKLEVALVIQREPLGPGDALRLGLLMRSRHVTSLRVLVLLADNVSTTKDIDLVTAHDTAVGVRKVSAIHAERFTRLTEAGWIEKKPIEASHDYEQIICWVGPIVGSRTEMEKAMREECTDAYLEGREALIGPHLGRFSRDGKHTVVHVSSYDVGTIDSYLGGPVDG